MLFSGRSSSLGTLVRYGLGMAGNGEETGRGGDWLGPLFEQLKVKIQATADKVCEAQVDDLAGAEKVARAVGVVARSAKAVDALRLRAEADSEEDEMGGRPYDPAEDERIRQELLVHHERLDRLLEAKRSEAAERAAAKAGLQPVPADDAPDTAH